MYSKIIPGKKLHEQSNLMVASGVVLGFSNEHALVHSFDKIMNVRGLSKNVLDFFNSKNSNCTVMFIFCLSNVGLFFLFFSECIYDKQNQNEPSLCSFYLSKVHVRVTGAH